MSEPDAPPSDAPPSDAPPSDAPPSDAPPSDDPPSDDLGLDGPPTPWSVARVRAVVGAGLGLALGAVLGAMVLVSPGSPPGAVMALAILLAGGVGAVPSAVGGWAETRLRERPALAGLIAWLTWVGALGAGAMQLVYLRGAFDGGPDAGLAAVEQAVRGLSLDELRGAGLLAGMAGAAVLPCALMIRARAAGPPAHGLALAAMPGSAVALLVALFLTVLTPGLDTRYASAPVPWAVLQTASGGALGVLLLFGWALLPAWAASFWLTDRAEAAWRGRGARSS